MYKHIVSKCSKFKNFAPKILLYAKLIVLSIRNANIVLGRKLKFWVFALESSKAEQWVLNCLANVTLSSYKSAKTAETSENLPFGGDIQGRFAKHLHFFLFRNTENDKIWYVIQLFFVFLWRICTLIRRKRDECKIKIHVQRQ